MNTTIAKVWAAIVLIPLLAIALASAMGGDSDRGNPEADFYGGDFNPCLIISCEPD